MKVSLTDGRVVETELDPNLSCVTAFTAFAAQHPPLSSEDYCFYLPTSDGSFAHLEDLKQLFETQLHLPAVRAVYRNSSCACRTSLVPHSPPPLLCWNLSPQMRDRLVVRLRPIVVKVKLSNGIVRTCEFDSGRSASQILSQIVTTYVGQSNSQDYALILENEATFEKIVLEADRLLSSYAINEQVRYVYVRSWQATRERSHYAILCWQNCLRLELLAKLTAPEAEEVEVEEGPEVNIWDEPDDNPDNITFEGGTGIQNIETASLNKLVERVTSDGEYGTLFAACTGAYPASSLIVRISLVVAQMWIS